MPFTQVLDENQENIVLKFPDKRRKLEEYIATLSVSDNLERNRSLLIQSLHKAQEIFTYLPLSVQLLVANKLKLHLADVYGVMSFYSFFTDKPIGKYKINICLGTACFVKGAGKILEGFQNYLHVGQGETTEDKKFTLASLRCVGACSLAPVVMVNDRVYGNVTADMVPTIINACE